jgi:hypothetical protein
LRQMLRRRLTRASCAARPPSLGKPAGRRLRELLLGPGHNSSAVRRGESAVGGGGETVASCLPSLAPRPAARCPTRGRLRGADTHAGGAQDQPGQIGGDWSSCALLKASPRIGSMSARASFRTPNERRALVENVTPVEHRTLLRQSKAFATFAGHDCAGEDLIQVSFVAALEGKPPWRTTQTLPEYCALVMARRVGFSAPKSRGKGRSR